MKTLDNVDVSGKKVLLREDLNLAIDGRIGNEYLLQNAAKTINGLRNNGAKVILISELGDPQGHIQHNLRMENIVAGLEKTLNTHIINLDDITKDTVHETVESMVPGEVVLLENLGFYKEEYDNEESFANELAQLADIYVDDDFRIADKNYASNCAITNFLPSYAGPILKEELNKIRSFLENVTHPFVMLIGGVNPESKLPLIDRLLPIADTILVTGEIALAFLKAQGNNIGDYTISDTAVNMAKEILYEAEKENCEILLPVDFLVADQITKNAKQEQRSAKDIPEGWFAVDIGPKTLEHFIDRIDNAELVLWNGPVGVYEIPEFEYGTHSIVQALASTDAKTIIGGVDTVNAVNRYGKSKYMDVISYGGESFLSYLKAQEMPGIKALG